MENSRQISENSNLSHIISDKRNYAGLFNYDMMMVGAIKRIPSRRKLYRGSGSSSF